MIGDATVWLIPDPTGAGPKTDITCLVDQVAIHHGRDDADSQPEASSATLDLAPPFETDTMPGALEVGAVIRVEVATITTTSVRFVGRVTDVSFGWEEAGPDTPNRLTGQVIAVGPLADLGRRIVGDVPWAQQLDGARVAAVLAAAGVILDPLYSDPGTVQILARDVDSRAALEVASGTAESANGMVWQTRAGQVRYADADHRRGIPVGLTLDACDVLVTPTWKRSSEALLNRVSLGYGPVPAEGEQARYVADRVDSVARFGRYELSTETELALLADATAMGQLLLTRNASPVWVMSELPVDVKGLDAARTDALLALDVHSLVALTGLPSAGAAPTTTQLWLEGWSETLAWGSHEITLAVTGYCRTVPAPRWNDVDPAWVWGDQTLVGTDTNLAPNPGGESGSAGMATNGSATWSLAMDAVAPISGTQSWVMTRGGVATTSPSYVANAGTTYGAVPCLPGDTVTFGVDLRTEAAARRKFRGYIQFRDAANVNTVATPNTFVDINAPGTARYVLSAAVPAGPSVKCHAVLQVQTWDGSNAPVGERTWWDRHTWVVNGDTSGAYWDGDTPDTETDVYAWTGTPQNSPSTRTAYEPGGGPAGWSTQTWDDMACLGPPQTHGRWDDTPASTRWNLVPPATTWNNWKG